MNCYISFGLLSKFVSRLYRWELRLQWMHWSKNNILTIIEHFQRAKQSRNLVNITWHSSTRYKEITRLSWKTYLLLINPGSKCLEFAPERSLAPVSPMADGSGGGIPSHYLNVPREIWRRSQATEGCKKHGRFWDTQERWCRGHDNYRWVVWLLLVINPVIHSCA